MDFKTKLRFYHGFGKAIMEDTGIVANYIIGFIYAIFYIRKRLNEEGI